MIDPQDNYDYNPLQDLESTFVGLCKQEDLENCNNFSMQDSNSEEPYEN